MSDQNIRIKPEIFFALFHRTPWSGEDTWLPTYEESGSVQLYLSQAAALPDLEKLQQLLGTDCVRLLELGVTLPPAVCRMSVYDTKTAMPPKPDADCTEEYLAFISGGPGEEQYSMWCVIEWDGENFLLLDDVVTPRVTRWCELPPSREAE